MNLVDWTDSYFTNARQCVEKDGDVAVIYALFVRVPSMCAPRIAVEWLQEYARDKGFKIEISSEYREGDIIPAGEPLLYVGGPFRHLVECETLLLQRIGPPFVAALNAYHMCCELKETSFISMGARHCTGPDMQKMMDYAASVGGRAAQEEYEAKGFINCATHATAGFFGWEQATGTMPHALIGYYNSTLESAKHYRKYHPEKPFIVLNDYFGQEITDSLEVANHFKQEADNGTLMFRIDTNGARYMEGLDYDTAIEVIRKNIPEVLKMHFSERELKALYGQGVSAAAIWHFRNEMDRAGLGQVGIVGSSGFDISKCRVMRLAQAPLNAVGTGSFIPAYWNDTHATADIIRYGSEDRIKAGREYLVQRHATAEQKGTLKSLLG